MSDQKTALVLGASGLVGQQLVRQLLADSRYQKVTCLLRSPLTIGDLPESQQKLECIEVDFEQLPLWQGYFTADHIFVCLGTTIRQAGSKQAFRKVDFEYVHVAAQLARDQRAKSLVWISSVGASSKSSNFYLRVKGELEDALLAMSGLNNAAAVRPSLLTGQRARQRPLEQLGIHIFSAISPLMRGPLAKYKPVSAKAVAADMIQLQVFE